MKKKLLILILLLNLLHNLMPSNQIQPKEPIPEGITEYLMEQVDKLNTFPIGQQANIFGTFNKIIKEFTEEQKQKVYKSLTIDLFNKMNFCLHPSNRINPKFFRAFIENNIDKLENLNTHGQKNLLFIADEQIKELTEDQKQKIYQYLTIDAFNAIDDFSKSNVLMIPEIFRKFIENNIDKLEKLDANGQNNLLFITKEHINVLTKEQKQKTYKSLTIHGFNEIDSKDIKYDISPTIFKEFIKHNIDHIEKIKKENIKEITKEQIESIEYIPNDLSNMINDNLKIHVKPEQRINKQNPTETKPAEDISKKTKPTKEEHNQSKKNIKKILLNSLFAGVCTSIVFFNIYKVIKYKKKQFKI